MKVAIVMDAIPSYRRGFYQRLLSRDDVAITVFCQDRVPGFNLKLIHDEFSDHVVLVPFAGTTTEVGWQTLPLRRLWRDFDGYVIYGNPRILSNVLTATVFRLLGRRVVIWGQGHSASANPVTESLRLAWWRLFDRFLVYTDREAEELARRGFGNKRVLGLNNGLDQQRIEAAKARWTRERLDAWQVEQGIDGHRILVSVARLVPEKGFEFVVRALPGLVRQFPDLVWCAIGDGSARPLLEAEAKAAGIAKHIRWLGAIYNEEELAPWLLSSRVLVHPGAIGLSLLHAFGYGLPVVTHDDVRDHYPEIAALRDGENGLLFTKGDTVSFQAVVAALLQDRSLSERLGRDALHVAQTEYNVDMMASRFVEALRP